MGYSSVTDRCKTSMRKKKIEKERLSRKRRDWKLFAHQPVYNINDATFKHKPIST
jgi:hypothetical protein